MKVATLLTAFCAVLPTSTCAREPSSSALRSSAAGASANSETTENNDDSSQQRHPQRRNRGKRRNRMNANTNPVHHPKPKPGTRQIPPTTTIRSSSASPLSQIANDVLLVRGHGTNLCWRVDNGRYASGTLLVLAKCDVTDRHQYFVKCNYSYDAENGSSSWLFRPVGSEYEAIKTEREEEDENEEYYSRANGKRAFGKDRDRSRSLHALSHNLHVVGHKYAQSPTSSGGPVSSAGSWRMVLEKLDYGVTDPMTQVFWTIPTKEHDESGHGFVDTMGMGQSAYSTRLFVTNEGNAAEVDVTVALRTQKKIEESRSQQRLSHPTPSQTSALYDLLTGRKIEERGRSSASVIPGKWSYVYVNG